MNPLIQKRLSEINPLRSLGEAVHAELMETGTVEELAKGTLLFRQGDEDDLNVYLLSGRIRTEREGGAERVIDAGSDASNYALGNLQPRPFSAFVAEAGTMILKLPRAEVEGLVARTQVVTSEMPQVTVTDLSETQVMDSGWMFQLLQSALFRDMPTENIERFFATIERIEVPAEEDVVTQGEKGEHFYMISSGECEVERTVNGLAFPIATLGAGDSFGEEALISGKPRNATVRTKADSVLMRLGKKDFEELFNHPLIKSLSGTEARSLIRSENYQLVDVRMESEHGARSIRGSLNLPLYRLRDEAERLDPARPVLTYCDTGVRSRIGAFLLSQRGMDACYLDGGLSALLTDA